MKEIEIDGQKFEIKCTAYTRFQYKKIFGVGIFEDINRLNYFNSISEKERAKLESEGKTKEEIEESINNILLDKLDEFLDAIERIAYIEILTANPSLGSFEKWLSGITQINLSDPWIAEVTEYAVNSFCGR